MTQPSPGAGSPTDDIHSAGTPRVSLKNAHSSPRSGLNRLVMPRPPAPGSQRSSPRPASASGWRASPVRPRIAPPAPPTRALRLELCDRHSSSQPLTPTARRCPSSASPPRLAAPARSPRPPYCVPSALPLLSLRALPSPSPPARPPPPSKRPLPLSSPPPLLPLPLLSLSSTQPAALHPIRKRNAQTGGGLRDDALELAVARTCASEQTVIYSASFGPRNEEICTFISVLPNCELPELENEHLLPPPAQVTERTEGLRTSGRSWGAGRRKD